MTLIDVIETAWSQANGQFGAGPGFDAALSPAYVRHSGETTLNREEFTATVDELIAAFPDLTMTIADAVEDGDRVAYRWESVGTHSGPYLGIPATHRRVTARGMTISRFEDGRIVEDWTSWDKASVLSSLGIIQLR
jgi:steroid delta-isomerase-like uncharacterized protein